MEHQGSCGLVGLPFLGTQRGQGEWVKRSGEAGTRGSVFGSGPGEESKQCERPLHPPLAVLSESLGLRGACLGLASSPFGNHDCSRRAFPSAHTSSSSSRLSAWPWSGWPQATPTPPASLPGACLPGEVQDAVG